MKEFQKHTLLGALLMLLSIIMAILFIASPIKGEALSFVLYANCLAFTMAMSLFLLGWKEQREYFSLCS